MNKQELLKNLNILDIKPSHYAIDGGVYGDSTLVLEASYNHYGLDKKYQVWNVFRFERGTRYDERTFNSEDEACNFIYEELKGHQERVKKYNLKD